MHSPAPRRSPAALILAAIALAVTLVLPTGASAGKVIRIDPNPDPLAPSGQVPEVLFEVSGLTKGRDYLLYADLERGKPDGTCETSVGNGLAYQRAERSRLVWDTRPGYFVEEPELYAGDYASFAPCKGTYEGKLEIKGSSGGKTLKRFTVTVPKLELRYLSR
jgi:hypothetical protein